MNAPTPSRLSTGLTALDDLLGGGLLPGSLTVVVGATGIGQVHELVTQLRGEAGARQVEGAQNAIAENGGGLHGVEEAAACVTILGR